MRVNDKCVFVPLKHEEEEIAHNSFHTKSCNKTMHLTITFHEKAVLSKGTVFDHFIVSVTLSM